MLGLTEMDTSPALSPGTWDATAACSAATLALTSPACVGGKLKLAVTSCCCPDESGGSGGMGRGGGGGSGH